MWRRVLGVSTREKRCRPARSKPRVRSNLDLPPPGREIGAGEGNRTLVVSLEGFCSTIELHPLGSAAFAIGAEPASTFISRRG